MYPGAIHKGGHDLDEALAMLEICAMNENLPMITIQFVIFMERSANLQDSITRKMCRVNNLA